jgi:hypothetical protein
VAQEVAVGIRWFLVTAILVALWAAPTAGGEPPYEVQQDDTLWDLSSRFWEEPFSWPELWALNPHIHNPHWIYPGDEIYLERQRRRGMWGPIRLPLERLTPPHEDAGAPGGTSAGAGRIGPAGQRSDLGGEGAEGLAEVVRLARKQTQDFVSAHRIPRLGVVDNRHQIKNVYVAGENFELTLTPDSPLTPGDRATVFDDSEPVTHPVSRKPQGYYVSVLGHMEVVSVSGNRAVCRLVETYDVVEDGDGVMTYSEPPHDVIVHPARVGVDGVILRGKGQWSFATEQVVFLDRGSIHGLDPGVVVDVPPRQEERAAQGVVDLTAPLARILVVSVLDQTSAGVIVESRAAVKAGDRFVATPP